METYNQCFSKVLYQRELNDSINQNINRACFKGFFNTPKLKSVIIPVENFIDLKIQKRLCYLINKLKPCKIHKLVIDDQKTLCWELELTPNKYDYNFFFFEFIRITWWCGGKQLNFNHSLFFKLIQKRKPVNLDYLEFLTLCLQKAGVNSRGFVNHTFNFGSVMVKNLKDLEIFLNGGIEKTNFIITKT